jgi:7,8-dihydropterin-6-yl-methyl-4-(beta-D-ribofuranosyl)aminobenzene 5'-phosphate synthase
MNGTITIILGILGLVALVIIGLIARFYIGCRHVDRIWTADHYAHLKDIGAVHRLTILPLIDRKPARSDLVGEAGVSYLVQADDTGILFDVGLNKRGEHPSPLLRNMEALGVTLERVQYIIISHLHRDHVGGTKNPGKHTFDLSGLPADLSEIPTLVPTRMTHPTAKIEMADSPRVIAPGIISLGVIPRQLFWLGLTLEQSLAINVEDKGIVLIVGCGHPTIQRIVQKAEALLGRPIYGVVGGLHYPVTALPVQRFWGANNWPWNPVNKKDVSSSIEFLQRRHLKVVAVSPHDSCDWTIEAFRQAFSEAYQDVLVGKEIVV